MEDKNLKPFSIRWLTRTAILLAITLAFQMLGFPQMVTGPAVNAMLLISGTYVGIIGAVIIGMLTPLIAFVRGILAPPLAPMIPFIMVGNAVLIIAYVISRAKLGKGYAGSAVGLIIGAIIKFLILSSAVRFIVSVPPPVAKAMQIPQLYTALLGGVIAFIVEKILDAAIKQNRA
ncbi:MAG TPA: ECF transporter S component [Tepidanaerobacter syntrophicus]|uniref:ECF transporter S component n=1 Tax=Tepidanaerobacter syntrophicus TaxID=224999 RepID=UPI001775553B|nr:ECF transporter S component [Tepidanaerobacter syntrophicus]HHV82451.1 ECF transporter S component [Tepidanaerobacter syntrophicus]